MSGDGRFAFEYVTGQFFLSQDIEMAIDLTNDSDESVDTRMVIYQWTKAEGTTIVGDTDLSFPPRSTGGQGFGPQEPGGFWVRIQATSEFLVPQVSIVRRPQPPDIVWLPYLLYTPGDFAVFALQPERHRIW